MVGTPKEWMWPTTGKSGFIALVMWRLIVSQESQVSCNLFKLPSGIQRAAEMTSVRVWKIAAFSIFLEISLPGSVSA